MRLIFLGGAAVAGLLAANPVAAEEISGGVSEQGMAPTEPPAEADDEQTKIVVIGQRIDGVPGGQVARGATLGVFGDSDLYNTAVSTKSFTEAFIQNQLALASTELVARDASYVITSAEALNQGGAGRLRGFRMEPFESSFDGFTTIASRRIPIEIMSRVDILKGPTAVFTGIVGGVGGTINYVSKKPLATPLTQITGLFSSQAQFGGQIDISRRFGADDQFGVRVNLAGRDGESAIDEINEDSRVAHVAFNWRRPGAVLDVQYGYYRNRLDDGVSGYFVGAGIPIPRAPDGDRVSGPAWDTREVGGQFVRAQLDVELTKGLSAFAVVGAGTSNERFVGLSPSLLDAAGNATGSAFAQQGKSDWGDDYNIDAGLRGQFDTGPIGHSVTVSYGLIRRASAFSDLLIDPAFVQPLFNIYDPASYEGTAPRVIGTGNYFPFQNSKTQGVVIADQLSAFGDRLLVTAGVRYTRIAIDTFSFGAATPDGRPLRRYRSDDWSPAFAALFKITPKVSVYANYLKAVENGAVAQIPAVNAGEIIPPGVSTQYEAGMKVNLGRFGITAAAFDITRPSTFIDPNTLVFGLFGRDRHRGIEFDIFGEPLPGVRLLLSYAYLDAEIEDASNPAFEGNTPVSVPENVLVLNADADVPGVSGLAVLANLRFVDRQFYGQDNLRTIPSFTAFDAGVRYTFNAGGTPLTARLNVTNLFDKNYFQSTDFSLQTGQPRTVRFALTANF